jgi:hypothetical protein
MNRRLPDCLWFLIAHNLKLLNNFDWSFSFDAIDLNSSDPKRFLYFNQFVVMPAFVLGLDFGQHNFLRHWSLPKTEAAFKSSGKVAR